MKMSNQATTDIQEQLETTRNLLAEGKYAKIKRNLDKLTITEVILLLESAPPNDRLAIWKLIPIDIEAEVLQELNHDVRLEIVKIMNDKELRTTALSIAKNLQTDDIVDLLQDLSTEKLNTIILESLDKTNRQEVEQFLNYPEDSAGGAMNNDAIVIPHDISIALVIEYLQRLGTLPEHTDNIFVVDHNRKYVGTIAITTLLTKHPNKIIKELIQEDSASNYLLADASSDQVAFFFEKNDLLSVAVVDEEHKVIGRITADDVVDIVREMGEHAYLGMAGLDEEIDTFAPVKQSIQKRFLWLIITLTATYFSTVVIGLFEPTIEKVIAVAILMPVTAAIGGAAGNQTLALVLRGIVLQQVGSSNFRWLLRREILVSLANGMMLASLIAIVTLWRFNDPSLSLVIFFAIVCNLLLSSVLGSSIPMLMKKLNIDPAISGNVILTTVTDIMGYILFLGLATLIY